MQYVGKLVSSVYNTITPNINPSTLNGAIDVIVVEREVDVDEKVTHADGSESVERRRTTELAASPFHVRFGKMSVLRPDERKVRAASYAGDAPSERLLGPPAVCDESRREWRGVLCDED